MFLTEYDQEKAFRQQREDGREEGREEGALMTLISLVEDGILTMTQAAERANLSVEEFEGRKRSSFFAVPKEKGN